MMNDRKLDLTAFKYGWYSFELQRYRPGQGTYDLYSYTGLPPIDEIQLNGTLQWLIPLDEDLDRRIEKYRPSQEQLKSTQENLQKIVDQAQVLGLTLPDAFLQLMSSTELQNRIPSCTACYFELPERFVPCPGNEQGYIIRFLNDQQGVLTWYLYLTPMGEHCILVSRSWFDWLTGLEPFNGMGDLVNEITEEERIEAIEDTYICSLSFEAFIYRFWLENTIWYNLNDQKPLTEEQRRYLEHYRQDKGKS